MATRSKGGLPWSTKLQRVRELSKGNSDIVFNNIGHIIDESFLLDCFLQLDGAKAVGIDGVTKEMYGRNIVQNIKNLLIQIRRGVYTPKASRITEIPKDDGSKRPLAIACLEDKLVQSAVKRILEEIYEPVFLPCSFGFRPGRNAHDALRTLLAALYGTPNGSVIDIDIRKYFNTVPHGPLEEMLDKKISDQRFRGLIHKLLTAPVLNDRGKAEPNLCGVPQGSILSPVLANIYLHHVTDKWVEDDLKPFFRSPLHIIRYADDMVFITHSEHDGQRLFQTLPKRFAKYGLTMAQEKSSVVPTGRFKIAELMKAGKPMPKFKILGFVVSWTKTLSGKAYRGRVKPRQDRMNKRLADIKEYLRKNLNTPDHMIILRQVKRVMDGWMRYFHVTDTSKDVRDFRNRVRRMIHRWFNRRGNTSAMDWTRLQKIFDATHLLKPIPLTSLISNPTNQHKGVTKLSKAH